ncbi:glucosidase 2 subunit beta [Myotis lucifugus]|uniref:glucosidase 2 subunit beta n=1 Tax=Myotis lucifugus TaxID=59463 RepID=UPI000CCC17EB|nr:glucosidase 2 subunit beta [Myotis lucifugus]
MGSGGFEIPPLRRASASARSRLPPPGPASGPRASSEMLLLVLLLPACWAVEVRRPRGVSLTNHHFYDESKPFTCLDGSITIPFDQVNDDYCDCKDGSDEPGTAACPNGSFHCTNTGYKPLYISSRWVNDGVCDCCDGTDEYNSGIVCENTCREKGRKERETLQQMAEVTREGFRLKKILIEDWKKAREEKQQKLTELQTGKKSLEDQVEMLRTVKEEAEKPEKEAKDQHQKLWEEQQAASKAQREQELAASAFQELDDNMDGVVSVAELQTHPELDTDGDGVLSEGEAQVPPCPLAWDSWRGWPHAPKNQAWRGHLGPGEASTTPASPRASLPPHRVLLTCATLMAAQEARNKFEEAERSLRDMEEAIRNLEQEISFDFGPSGEFAYLYKQCYELTTNEYVYRLCLFKHVSQQLKLGGGSLTQPRHLTLRSTWGSWAGSEHDRFSSMKYEQGTGCWQGPNCSTTPTMMPKVNEVSCVWMQDAVCTPVFTGGTDH